MSTGVWRHHSQPSPNGGKQTNKQTIRAAKPAWGRHPFSKNSTVNVLLRCQERLRAWKHGTVCFSSSLTNSRSLLLCSAYDTQLTAISPTHISLNNDYNCLTQTLMALTSWMINKISQNTILSRNLKERHYKEHIKRNIFHYSLLRFHLINSEWVWTDRKSILFC